MYIFIFASKIPTKGVNYDKYSVVFQSKFNADTNVSITGLEYSKAAEILSKITEGIINKKFYLNLKVEGI